MTLIDRHLRRKIGQIQRDREIIVTDAIAGFGPPPARPEPVRAGRALLHMLAQLIARAVRNGVHAWMRRGIRTLRSLDDCMLAEIGLTRAAIEFYVREQTMRQRSRSA